MVATPPIRCLVLACGNTLRSDDGVGPWLAARIEERFAADPGIHVITRQQWTPELAEPLARAEAALFLDSSLAEAPGSFQVRELKPRPAANGLVTHHLGAEELLALAIELYAATPKRALLLTVGAGSTELGEEFSASVRGCLREASTRAECTILDLLASET